MNPTTSYDVAAQRRTTMRADAAALRAERTVRAARPERTHRGTALMAAIRKVTGRPVATSTPKVSLAGCK